MAISSENLQAIFQILCKLLRDSEEPVIRAKAALSLGKLGIESAIPELCRATSADPDIQVRLNTMDALVFIAKPELATVMTESPKNQPTFHIDRVGHINSGDVKVERDMIGIQYNYTFLDPKQTETASQILELLKDIRQQYPQASEAEILDIIQRELATLHHKICKNGGAG